MENTEKLDFDLFVMEFQKAENSIGAISITKADLETLSNMHGIGIQEIAADMAEQLMESIRSGEIPEESFPEVKLTEDNSDEG